MATNLKEYVRLYDDAFDAPFCNNVIEQFHKSESTYLDRDNRPTFHELNISQRFMAKDPLWDLPQRSISSIFQTVVSKYVTTMDIGPDFPERWGYEEFRLKMYENNDYDQFKEHVDVGDHASARRFLVCFLYLNDVEEGGETEFLYQSRRIKPKQGTMVICPASFTHTHRGNPPLTGDKYMINGWIEFDS
mgnify:CR=1 FL=1